MAAAPGETCMQRTRFVVVLYILAIWPLSSAAANEPAFLGLAEARNAIVDETRETYFSRLQPMEMAAKTGARLTAKTLAGQRDETRRRYRESVREFTAAERDTIRWYLSAIQPKLAAAYPALAATPWRFIKVTDSIEGGLPHTRGGNIVLSQGALDGLRRMRTEEPAAKALFSAGELLVHELIHVHQRIQPDRYAALYREHWGFVKARRIKATAWMQAHQLMNPDGSDVTWIYPLRRNGAVRWILPLVAFAEGAEPKRMPHDMRMIAVTVQGGDGRFRVTAGGDGTEALAKVPEYAERFIGISSIYHPNEIAADYASTLFVLDEMFPEELFAERARQAAAYMFRDQRWLFRRFYRQPPLIGARP